MLERLTLNPSSFGLDLSDSSIKIINLEKRKGGPYCSAWGEMKLERGIIEAGEIKNEDALVQAIKNAVSNIYGEKIKTKHVVASLPEERSFLQVIQMPKLSEEEMVSSIHYEVENYIPLSIDNVYFDFQLIRPAGHNINHVDVLINAIPREIIDPYVRCIKRAGLIPGALEIESQAITRALINKNRSDIPTLIVDIGENKTIFIIFSGTSLRFTFSFPFSSSKITQSIAEKSAVDMETAEDIKRKYNLQEGGRDPELKDVFEAIRENLIDLTQEMKKHLEFYKTRTTHEHLPNSTGEVGKIILCGGGSNLRGIDKFVEERVGVITEIGNPWTNASNVVTKKDSLSLEKSLGLSTAIGLALRDF
ncbi:MAG: type IV pilus assembly protein PilM [Candidatus Nealsonbacteria bacterium]|nr:type IV pilus assembly protein PilM [Candidatus Nealsonbacteria bacterium]